MLAITNNKGFGAFLPGLDEALSATALELRELLIATGVPGVLFRLSSEQASPSAGDRGRQAAALLIEALTSRGADTLLPAPETQNRAAAFLGALPSFVPLPEVIVEDDGEIGFDWHLSRRHMASVHVGSTPYIGFAALIGGRQLRGREPFVKGLPSTLNYVLTELYGRRP